MTFMSLKSQTTRNPKKGLQSALVMAALLVMGSGTSQAATSNASGRARIIEVDVSRDPAKVNGQPVVAVNPTNPNNLVLISTAHVPDPTSSSNAKVSEFQCFAAFSNDGGRTWTATPFPRGDRPQCGDPYLAVDRRGTFYTAFNRLGCPGNPAGGIAAPCPQGRGQLGVARSLDGGRTWSEPVDTTAGISVTPRLRVDEATGKIYAVGSKGGASSQAVAVSSDQGVTWAVPSPLPAQPFGNQIAVYDGVLATATALSISGDRAAPAEMKVAASDVKFWVSTDEGRTFTSFAVTDSNGSPVRPPQGSVVPDNTTLKSTDPVPFVSADPTRRGRFALMIPRNDKFEVYLTANAGRTWTGPSVIAAPGAAKPWMDFGANGNLGVMWRTLGGDMVNVYSAVSFDGGNTFSRPLKVNRSTHRYGFPGSGGDEWSRILLDRRNAYVTWSDARSPGGSIDAIVARVPLSVYRSRRR